MDTTELLTPSPAPVAAPLPAAEPARRIEQAGDPTPDEDGRADIPPRSSRPVTIHVVQGGFVRLNPADDDGDLDEVEDPGRADIPPISSRVITIHVTKGGYVPLRPSEIEDD